MTAPHTVKAGKPSIHLTTRTEEFPMTDSAALTALRKRHYVLETLPGTIVIPAFGGFRRDPVVKSLEEATLDDIAFAVRGVEAELNAIGDRVHALRKLYNLARQAGALGADRAVEAAAKGDR